MKCGKIRRSPDCFEIGWPMRLDHDFFCTSPTSGRRTSKYRKSTISKEQRRNTPNEDEEMGVNLAC